VPCLNEEGGINPLGVVETADSLKDFYKKMMCMDITGLKSNLKSDFTFEVYKCYGSTNCKSLEEIDRVISEGAFMIPVVRSNFVDNSDFSSPV
jgi:hypothetical protein